jgi:hypothetical protein
VYSNIVQYGTITSFHNSFTVQGSSSVGYVVRFGIVYNVQVIIIHSTSSDASFQLRYPVEACIFTELHNKYLDIPIVIILIIVTKKLYGQSPYAHISIFLFIILLFN